MNTKRIRELEKMALKQKKSINLKALSDSIEKGNNSQFTPIQKRLGELGVNDDVEIEKLRQRLAAATERIVALENERDQLKELNHKLLKAEKQNRLLKERIQMLQAQLGTQDITNTYKPEKKNEWVDQFSKYIQNNTKNKTLDDLSLMSAMMMKKMSK